VSNAGGRSSRGSSPQSNYGSVRTVAGEGQDRVINHLKKELSSLKKHSKGLHETSSRLINMQHKYNIILSEKNRDDELYRRKDQEQEMEVNHLNDQLRLNQDKLNHREIEINDLRSSFQKLEQIVSMKEEQLATLDRDLATEYEQYRDLCDEKSRLENDKGSILQQQSTSFTNAEGLAKDIEAIKESVTRYKRHIKEHKGNLQELKARMQEVTSEIYRAEEELKNLVINQGNKESNLKRLDDKVSMIENEIALIDSEKDNLRQAADLREETLKYLGDAKAELLRKETVLAKEKLTVDQNFEDTEQVCLRKREEIATLENDKLSAQTELKTLKSFYERLVSENRKLVQGLKLVSDIDERAIRDLSRNEKIEHVVAEANREINTAMKVIRD